MDITEQIAELRAKLEELERQTQEEPKPLLTGPCVAKTRTGNVVHVYRDSRNWYCFQYLTESVRNTVSEDGKYRLDRHEHDCDIVEVIRPMSEKEVLDWQFRGIEPEISVASEPVGDVAEVFKPSDLGRKEAEEMGLIYLGEAAFSGKYEVDGTLYYHDCWYKQWRPKPDDYRIWEVDTYAYKPSGE